MAPPGYTTLAVSRRTLARLRRLGETSLRSPHREVEHMLDEREATLGLEPLSVDAHPPPSLQRTAR